MSNQSKKYIIGYIFRLILGTALTLCLISTARTLLLKDKIAAAAQRSNIQNHNNTVWAKLLIYPDKLVGIIIAKYAPQYALSNNSPRITHQSYSSPQVSPPLSTINKQPSNQTIQTAMPEIPTTPKVPEMTTTPDNNEADNSQLSNNNNDITEWGLTVDHETSVYSTNGKLIDRIPAGNILKVIEHKNSANGDLIICSLLQHKRAPSQVILRREDTILYNCNLKETPRDQLKQCIQHAKILGEISARTALLEKEAKGNNPYAAKHKQALSKYKAVSTKNNTLIKEYNSATGPKRMQLADKLRLEKLSAETTKKEYMEIKEQYQIWKSKNPAKSINLDQDPKLNALKQELAAIEHKLANP